MANLINRIGRPVTLTPVNGVPRQVTAVYTSRPGVAMMVEGFSPSLQLAQADAVDMGYGASVEISGKLFTVNTVFDDGLDTGVISMTLESQ